MGRFVLNKHVLVQQYALFWASGLFSSCILPVHVCVSKGTARHS